ncbi:uncharacterized protein LOC101784725 isoform X1 [Setaria italica]|uniref:uncharacterized protein LOC101784725 isoform X1 n=1 Tax=Setaria italica TaxID=4555 RepID=UPI000BE5018C|nr:uncharacterized protein LOC101784725 isoform X1 [Setaria italica]
MCGWVVGISSAGWAPPVLWARSIGPLRVYDPGLAVIRAKRSERREKRFSQFTPSSYPSDTAAAADGVKPSLPAPFRACTRSASHGARHLQVQRSPAATSSRSPFLPSSSPVPPVRVPRRPPATFRCNYYYGDGGGFRKNYDHIPKQFREENLKDGRAYDLARQDTIPQDFNADSLHIRRIPEFHHASLKKVSINQFFSSKSLIELTCQIVENTSSLRYLVLDTTSSFYPRSTCKGMYMHAIRKARCAVEAVERYIVGKVPSSVKFKVLEPCS